jgi:hypothetical protein
VSLESKLSGNIDRCVKGGVWMHFFEMTSLSKLEVGTAVNIEWDRRPSQTRLVR